MKTLLLMRHGKSSWKDQDIPDHERPLKKKGKKDSEKMGEMLKDQHLVPDSVLSSTAKRARSTAEIVTEACKFDGEIQYLDSFYHAETSDYLDVLSHLADEVDCVLIIGHNPSLEAFVQILSNDIEALPTAAIARIELPVSNWSELGEKSYGKLINLWSPRSIED